MTTSDNSRSSLLRRRHLDYGSNYDKILPNLFSHSYAEFLFICLTTVSGNLVCVSYVNGQYFFEVPTCQHEVSRKLNNESDLTYKAMFRNFSDRNLSVSCSGVTALRSNIVDEFGIYSWSSVTFALVNSSFFVSVAIGVLLCGPVSDRYGRKRTALFASIGYMLSGFAAALIPTPYVLLVIVLRNASGFLGIPIQMCCFVIAMENVQKSQRSTVMQAMATFVDIQRILGGVLALTISNWRYLQATVIILGIIPFFALVFLTPESVRWMLIHNKRRNPGNDRPMQEEIVQNMSKFSVCKKADKTLLNECMRNYFEVRENLEENLSEPDNKKSVRLFRYPLLMLSHIEICFIWFISGSLFWGTATTTGNYIDSTTNMKPQVILILMGVSSIILVDLIFSRISNALGRRKLQVFALVVSASTMACLALIQSNGRGGHNWKEIAEIPLVIVCNVAGQFSVNLSFVRASEIYPTVYRNTLVGFAAMCARTGISLYPLVDLTRVAAKFVPSLIWAVLSILAALMALDLPETNNHILPSNPEESNKLVRGIVKL